MSDERFHTDDIFHVILDAVGAFNSQLREDATLQPWDDYHGATMDIKMTREGYLAVLAAAEEFATAVLNENLSRATVRLTGIDPPL